jgi:hypothetical protein
MGILSKFFGSRGSATQNTIATAPEWRIDDGWLTIRAVPQFFGKTRKSMNDRWTVAWCERNISTARVPPESGGSVVLLDHHTNEIRQQILDLERPMGAAVSDVGTFAVHDALAGEGLQGKVLGYSIDGQELFHRKYSANVWTLGISPCGRYVAVQTLNAPNDDGYRFEVLDLLEKRIRFSVSPATGLADHYRFDVTSTGLQRVFVVHQGLGSFAYSADGEFLESVEFREALLTKGDFSQKIRAARELCTEDASMETARRTVKLADEALLEGALNHPSWAALAHRLKGEAYERLNNPSAAIASYERALSLDPKAGVRRAVQRLRKTSPKES